MSQRRHALRVTFVGKTDESLRALLEDVLDVDLLVDGESAELVLAIVGPRDPFRILALAQAAAGGRIPIIAILPLADDRLSRRALLAGARFCWPLDGPLKALRAAVQEVGVAVGAGMPR